MKKLFSLFAAFLFVGSMWATVYTVTIDQNSNKGVNDVHITNTTKNSSQTVEHDDVNWTFAWTGDGVPTSGSTTQCQIGTGSNKVETITARTSDISGTITSVKVKTWGASSTAATCSVTVGTSAFECDEETTVSLNNTSDNEFEFTGSASGAIVISWAQSTAKAIYIKQISVTYTEAPPTVVANPRFSLDEGTYEGTQSVTISCNTADATIYYTTDGSNPKTSDTKATYSSAISVAATQTIKAYAAKAGLDDSEVISATYTILAAPDIYLNFSSNDVWNFPTTKTEEERSFTAGTYTIKVAGSTECGYNFDTNHLFIGKSGAYIVLPTPANNKTISRIKTLGVSTASGSVTFNVFNGEEAVSESVTSSKVDQTFDISDVNAGTAYKIKITNAQNARFAGIKIWLADATPSALETVDSSVKSVKFIQNGQLFIEQNGHIYNVMGQLVK